ncbi:unnamed protein product [Larinioides sclopetarius]
MKSAIVLSLCLLILHMGTAEAQRTRRPGGSRATGMGSGGPSGVRYPTDDEDDRRIRYPPASERGTSTGGLHAGKWPGGFYSGSKWL